MISPEEIENLLSDAGDKTSTLYAKLINVLIIAISVCINSIIEVIFVPIGVLLNTLGFDKAEIGWISAIFGAIATIFLAVGAYYKMKSDAKSNVKTSMELEIKKMELEQKKMEMEEQKLNLNVSNLAYTKHVYEEEIEILKSTFDEMSTVYQEKLKEIMDRRKKNLDDLDTKNSQS